MDHLAFLVYLKALTQWAQDVDSGVANFLLDRNVQRPPESSMHLRWLINDGFG